MNLPVETAI